MGVVFIGCYRCGCDISKCREGETVFRCKVKRKKENHWRENETIIVDECFCLPCYLDYLLETVNQKISEGKTILNQIKKLKNNGYDNNGDEKIQQKFCPINAEKDCGCD